MHRKTILFLLLILAAPAFSLDLLDRDQKTPLFIPGEVIVMMRDSSTAIQSLNTSSKEEKLKEITNNIVKDAQISDVSEIGGQAQIAGLRSSASNSVSYFSVKTTTSKDDTYELVERLRNHPGIYHAEPNYIYSVQKTPNDYFFSRSGSFGQTDQLRDQWPLLNIQAPEAWDITEGEGIVVAVVDTGLDYNHPDIIGNVWRNTDEIAGNGIDDDGNGFIDDIRGWDFTTCNAIGLTGCSQPKEPDNDPMDGNGHGTHVSGTIAAVGNNGIGMIGVAPKAKIMPIKGIGDDGNAPLGDLLEAVIYAARNGAHVINNSWGGPGESLALETAFNDLEANGHINIVAAGNSNVDVDDFIPARFDSVISVGATDENDKKSGFSNFSLDQPYGPTRRSRVDISAPGGGNDTEGTSLRPTINILSLRAAGTDLFEGSSGYTPGDFFISDDSGTPDLYYRLAGTSMAAPHVAGVAALLYSKFISDNPSVNTTTRAGRRLALRDVRGRLLYTGDPIDSPEGKSGGFGRVNAFRALTASPAPHLEVVGDRLEERQGNGNRIPDSGERIEVYLSLKNDWATGGAITASISSNDTGKVQIVKGSASFGVISGGATVENSQDPFLIDISTSGGMDSAVLELSINSGGVSQTRSFRLFFGARKVSATVQRPFDGFSTIGIPPVKPQLDQYQLVWTDRRGESLDIYHYNFRTGRERLITSKSSNPNEGQPSLQGRPDIDGKIVVWEDTRNGNSEIYYTDISKNERPKRVPVPAAIRDRHQLQPAVSGNNIVWTSSTTVPKVVEESDIWAYNINTGQTTQITNTAKSQLNPDISGKRVVYEDAGIAGVQYVPDLNDPLRKIRVQQFLTFPLEPQISGTTLVFPAVSLLGGINLFRGTPVGNSIRVENLTNDGAFQSLPALSGNHLAWQDNRDGDWNIYYRNLGSSDVVRISNLEGFSHQYAAVSESYIAWISGDILWATQVPGAAPPPPSGGGGNNPDGPSESGLQLSASARYLKKGKSLTLTMTPERDGSLASLSGVQCSYKIFGSNKRKINTKGNKFLRGTVDSTTGLLALQLQGLPLLKSKGKVKAVFLQGRMECEDGSVANSKTIKIRSLKRSKRGQSFRGWMKKFSKKLRLL